MAVEIDPEIEKCSGGVPRPNKIGRVYADRFASRLVGPARLHHLPGFLAIWADHACRRSPAHLTALLARRPSGMHHVFFFFFANTTC